MIQQNNTIQHTSCLEGAAHFIETLKWKMLATVFNGSTPWNHGDWPMTNVSVQFTRLSAQLYLPLEKPNTKIYNWHNQCEDAFTPGLFCCNALLSCWPMQTRHRRVFLHHRCLTLVAIGIAVHCHDNGHNNSLNGRSSEPSEKVECLVSIWPAQDTFPDVGNQERYLLCWTKTIRADKALVAGQNLFRFVATTCRPHHLVSA